MSAEIISELICYYCGKELQDEELENPYKDDDGDIMCDECYTEHYQTVCALCEEYFDEPQKPPTPTEPQYIYCGEGVEQRGIYKVREWPFIRGQYASDEWYDQSAILFVKPLPDLDRDTGGHICPDCVEKHLPEA